MAHKQLLHELLKEEQKPFHLKTYIADRRSQLRNTSQIKKRKPIIHTSPTNLKRSSLCKNACLFSFQNSPEFTKSPFLDFQSPGKSPCKSPNRSVFLHIPARTAALLVEAAMRIQTKQSKHKTQIKNVGFGLFGSIFKRLKDCTKNKRRMLSVGDNEVKFSRKIDEKLDVDIKISYSCDTNRLSSAGWSSSNDEKSTDLETSTSRCSDEIEYVAKGRANINGDFASCEKRFCSTPFRFSLRKSPSSSGRQTPDFSSPAASPSRHRKGDDGLESADVDEDDYDLECSYANVQRAKQQLLHRLHRFEKLAELDPIELERKLLEGSDDDDQQDREKCKDDEPFAMYREHSVNTFAPEDFSKSSLQKTRKISTDMKRLVSDLIVEQKSEMNCLNNSVVVFDTVDMMIELAFKQESVGWTQFREQEEETAAEIEMQISNVIKSSPRLEGLKLSLYV
ncbi:hypothetical protein Fot_32874 [Forsythia ovata]|uniref:Uncharacterized protein n=1 Tax=Forsythia ovata TaxID=205694 RepID=A0ABD1T929_9LAMI